ncbi:class I SAM-dependent methyltransferase [Candidatus Pelagibacter bacterium]|nr:class I SAM-dependent methyltransferase [Candidatus Pelagibacter bacterium]MDA8832426.1 class I SAM-dependent methyltransferase [Candidatus Pelagibacter bacterium]
MIKRTSKKYIDNLLQNNTTWNILDIGCGYNANKFAKVICDVQDLSNHYQDKKFIRLSENKLPFKDKEFDFVVASHVMEHVEDIDFFIKELERVSKKGYIELPTMFEDNLVFENKKDHLWHMDFDDVENKLLISKKVLYFEPVLTVSTIKRLNDVFRTSLVLELFWEDIIDYKINKDEKNNFKKISVLILKINSFILKDFFEFTVFIHFLNDVTATNKFTLNINLWNSRPVTKFFYTFS